jgi:hypothetical protein
MEGRGKIFGKFQISLVSVYLKRYTNTNAINDVTGTVGCVPRTHHLIGVIGDHAVQDRKRTKCICIRSNASLLKSSSTPDMM